MQNVLSLHAVPMKFNELTCGFMSLSEQLTRILQCLFLFADNLPESLFNPFDIISYQIKFAPSLGVTKKPFGPYETPKQAHNSPVPDSLFRETHCRFNTIHGLDLIDPQST